MHLKNIILALLIHREANIPGFQLFQQLPAPLHHTVVDRFIHNAFAGQAVGFHVQLRGGYAGDSHDVEGVHAPGYATGVFNFSFFKNDHLLVRIHFLCPDGGHGSGAASTDNEDIAMDHWIILSHLSTSDHLVYVNS